MATDRPYVPFRTRLRGGLAGLFPAEPGESVSERRRQILSGVIVLQGLLLVFVLAGEMILAATGNRLESSRTETLLFIAVMVAFLGSLLALNLRGYRRLASVGIFVVCTALALVSLRAETFQTRALLFVTVIIAASFVLRPAMSFAFAAIAVVGYTVA